MSMQVTNSNSHRNLKAITSITGDAITWGAVGGAIGAGVELASQRKILKNPEMLAKEIVKNSKELLRSDLKPSKKKFFSNALESLQKGKINYKSVAKTALNHGFWGWTVPTLVFNAVFLAGKAGYDKLKQHK